MGLISFLKDKFSKKEKNEKYVAGLDKSRKNFSSKLHLLTKKYSKVNEEYFEELEEILIEADVGVNLALDIVEVTRNETDQKKITDPKLINEILVDKMFVRK